MNNIKEFLMRKGPGGVPYWGYGLMGAAVIGGVIYVNAKGGFAALVGTGGTAPGSPLDTGSGGSGSGGSGSGGDQPTPPPSQGVPGAGGTPPPPPLAPDPPLIQGGGQQSGTSGSGTQGTTPATPEIGTVLNPPGKGLPYLIQGFFGPFRPAVTPPGYAPPTSGTIAQRKTYVAPAKVPTPTTSLEGHPGKQADDVLAPPPPITQGYQLANPVPASQPNVIQHTVPVKKGRSGGTQEL